MAHSPYYRSNTLRPQLPPPNEPSAKAKHQLALGRRGTEVGRATFYKPGWRPGTKWAKHRSHFVLTGGGLGDYICQMPVFEWIASEQPHVQGQIFAPDSFIDVAREIMKPYPLWKVTPVSAYSMFMEQVQLVQQQGIKYQQSIDEVQAKVEAIPSPDMAPTDLVYNPFLYQNRYINATGAHLMDIGSMYYANIDRLPAEWRRMPDLTGYKSGREWGLPENYAVVTPGYTSPARQIKAKYFNILCQHLVERGVTPVFIGKRDFAIAPGVKVDPDYHTKVDNGCDFTIGIDLREQTTLLEATEVMAGARLVLGVDNGLLHFAGCTETPIIFGHTVASVEHREIRRVKGRVVNIEPSDEDLPCRGCQSRMRWMPEHDFKYCIYDDFACTDALFANDARVWKDSIDDILGGNT